MSSILIKKITNPPTPQSGRTKTWRVIPGVKTVTPSTRVTWKVDPPEGEVSLAFVPSNNQTPFNVAGYKFDAAQGKISDPAANIGEFTYLVHLSKSDDYADGNTPPRIKVPGGSHQITFVSPVENQAFIMSSDGTTEITCSGTIEENEEELAAELHEWLIDDSPVFRGPSTSCDCEGETRPGSLLLMLEEGFHVVSLRNRENHSTRSDIIIEVRNSGEQN